jgi:hypothetical protein
MSTRINIVLPDSSSGLLIEGLGSAVAVVILLRQLFSTFSPRPFKIFVVGSIREFWPANQKSPLWSG